MKKFLLIVGLVVVSVGAYGSSGMKIVTTFPEPYGSYYELNVAGTCDIGLLGSSCSLEAGKGLRVTAISGDDREMNTGSLIVKSGELDLNSSGEDSKWTVPLLQVGGTGSSSLGQLKFRHDLTAGDINGEDSVYTVEAQNEANLSSLKMFGEKFPRCGADDNEIRWQKLKVNDEEGVFLVCGSGGETIEVNEDCCSITDRAKFKECIFANYDEDSVEYICARGTFRNSEGYMETGNTACAHAIANHGGASNFYLCLVGGLSEEYDAACRAAENKYSNWDYTRWACNKITPVVDTSIKDDGGESPNNTCTWKIIRYENIDQYRRPAWESNITNGGQWCTDKGNATPGSQSKSMYGQTCYYWGVASNWTEVHAGQTEYLGVTVPFMQCISDQAG